MRDLKELKNNEVLNSFQFIQSETTISVHNNLISIVLDYFTESLMRNWQGLFSSMKINPDLKSTYHPAVLEQFKIAFLITLAAIDQNPNMPLTLTFYKTAKNSSRLESFKLNFDNAFVALDDLLTHCYKDALDGLNLHKYLEQVFDLNQTDQTTLEFLKKYKKELILTLPGSREHAFTESDMAILYGYLEVSEQNPPALCSRITGSFDFPLYYFELENKNHYSLVTRKIDRRVDDMIADLQKYRQDEQEYEDRLGSPIPNVLESLLLLPTTLNTLIAAYIKDKNYFSFLAKSLLEQLQGLKSKYPDKFRVKTNPDGISLLEQTLQAIEMNKPILIDWSFAKIHGNTSHLKNYQIIAIKVLPLLIQGIQVSVPCDGVRYSHFYLLNFFQNLSKEGQFDPDVEKFILDILELAGTHIPFKVNKAQLQLEHKTFSSLAYNSPFTARMAAENNLNPYLRESEWSFRKEEPAIRFITVDETATNVTLYVKSDAQRAKEILNQFVWASIHLSPLFVFKLLQLFESGAYSGKWSGYGEEKRGKVIKAYMYRHLGIPTQTIQSVTFFGHYGHKVKLKTESYAEILSHLLKSGQEKSSNPTGLILLDAIRPIETQLLSLESRRDKYINRAFEFVDKFKKDFEEFAKISGHQEALQTAVSFINNKIHDLVYVILLASEEWVNAAASFEEVGEDDVGCYLPNSLKSAIVAAGKELSMLKESINSLIEKLSTNAIALTL